MNSLQCSLLIACLAIGAHASGQTVPTFEDLDYAGKNHLRQAIDLYVPSGVQDPAPVVVYIHGGGWLGGKKGHAMQYADSLLAAGYFVADISYRLSSDELWPAQIQDCKAAIQYLKLNAERFGLDSSRIGVMGHSAGGHLAAMLAGRAGARKLEGPYMRGMGASSTVHAVIDFYGPTNFLRMDDFPPDASWKCKQTIEHDSPESPESRLLGCPIQKCPERVASADPSMYVNGKEPPTWIVHGTQDCLVPDDQSRYLYRVMKQVGSPATLSLLEGEGHGGDVYKTPEMRREIRAFFDKHLRRSQK